MQKLSETIYSSLFWIISSLLVWLILLPTILVCVPFLLVRAVWQVLFNIPETDPEEAELKLPEPLEERTTNSADSLIVSLLLATIVGVPAFLSAMVSLQPTRFLKGEPVLTQLFPSLFVKSGIESESPDELSADEKTGEI